MPEVKSRTYANPRRLSRRNHCQEGPGFLFVATQGGRPPEGIVQAGQAATVRRRRAALRRWAGGEPLATIGADLGYSRASLFRWRTRFEQGGLEALLDRPRVGRASELPLALERLILTVRVLTYWNSRRIAAEFARRGVWPLGHGQVDRVLARHGSHRPSYVRTPGPRYERTAPNELWHIDLKGPFYLLGATGRARTCHFVALVDDHSRFLLGIRAVPTKEAVWVLALLEEAIELCGVPHELMTDNGTPFVAIVRTMLSRFQRSLAELEIRHIRTQIDTPWTNGKDVHLCQAASSARSGLNSVPALSIAHRTRSFVRARAMIAWWWDLPSARLRS
jgi:transposase